MFLHATYGMYAEQALVLMLICLYQRQAHANVTHFTRYGHWNDFAQSFRMQFVKSANGRNQQINEIQVGLMWA